MGILPTTEKGSILSYADIPVVTDMGNAWNNINVLTSGTIIVCGMGPGAGSKIALALKARKKVILLEASGSPRKCFEELKTGLVSFAIHQSMPSLLLTQSLRIYHTERGLSFFHYNPKEPPRKAAFFGSFYFNDRKPLG